MTGAGACACLQGLTLSVGVSTNKLLAKLATARAKPDGVAVLQPGAPPTLAFLEQLPVGELPGARTLARPVG